MATLYDLGEKIAHVRTAANGLVLSGSENAARVVYITQLCNEMIGMINEAAQAAKEDNSTDEQHSDTPQ